MVLTSPESTTSKRHTSGFLVGVSAMLARLAKRATRISENKATSDEELRVELRSSPKKSALARPKKMLSNISNKALPFGHHQKKKTELVDEGVESGEDEWGDGGVWQKAILMGDKCQPLDFSGVIYYDSNGKQMSEVPIKSPRVSPLPGYLTRRREQGL